MPLHDIHDKVPAVGTISVRVDDGLKRDMESMKHLNWSEIVRQAIQKAIDNEQGHDMARAVLLNDKIKKKALDHHDSADLIRRSRDERFGKNSFTGNR